MLIKPFCRSKYCRTVRVPLAFLLRHLSHLVAKVFQGCLQRFLRKGNNSFQFGKQISKGESRLVCHCSTTSIFMMITIFIGFDAVIHFAGMKSVSVQKPLLYFDNNLIGTITLLEVMAAHNCKKALRYMMQIGRDRCNGYVAITY
ncbi:hypothetical protein QN277_006917 [Acacia crassicarpa]|uniref:UDP-glucose 4-epimerase n=1 Tax=Acacia crassicarpa TaxID=499986 RepID=A0AAE1JQC5_9FABA|nr:hypothetical protein QN277_006917 [Acacia crassicarpa]